MKRLIFANWKLNKTIEEGLAWIHEVGPHLSANDSFQVVVCPSYVSLSALRQEIAAKEFSIKLAVQTVSAYEQGAYTGEVSAAQVAGLAEYALLGHSERRTYFNETNQEVEKKVELCKKYAIEPVVLIRDEKDTVPDGVTLFAWEPTSAIGTGHSIEAQEAAEKVFALKNGREDLIGMYGGSVNAGSISSYFKHDAIQGVVLGKASWETHTFLELLDAIR